MRHRFISKTAGILTAAAVGLAYVPFSVESGSAAAEEEQITLEQQFQQTQLSDLLGLAGITLQAYSVQSAGAVRGTLSNVNSAFNPFIRLRALLKFT